MGQKDRLVSSTASDGRKDGELLLRFQAACFPFLWRHVNSVDHDQVGQLWWYLELLKNHGWCGAIRHFYLHLVLAGSWRQVFSQASEEF